MNKSPDLMESEKMRATLEYSEAMRLLSEKALIQKRLREIDKVLRQLRIVSIKVTSLAQQDLEEKNEVAALASK